jgi:hypothetical protein
MALFGGQLAVSSEFGFAYGYSMHGEGFGNNGVRFQSFVGCGDDHKRFAGGAHLEFKVISNRSDQDRIFSPFSGAYKIELWESGKSFPLIKSGDIVLGIVDNSSSFLLVGREKYDTVCETKIMNDLQLETIILTGTCGEANNLSYLSMDDVTIGSISPPQYARTPSFPSSNVWCGS